MSTPRTWPQGQQWAYNQQYPQYGYPQPYYYHYPPAKKGKDKAIIAIVVSLAVGLVVAPTIISFAMFSPFSINGETPTAQFTRPQVTTSTDAKVQLDRISIDPPPTEFGVILIRDGRDRGFYEFTSNYDGELKLISGTDVGNLYYEDQTNNADLGPGDEILMSDLTPDSRYEIQLHYIPTGSVVSSASFTTPPAR